MAVYYGKAGPVIEHFSLPPPKEFNGVRYWNAPHESPVFAREVAIGAARNMVDDEITTVTVDEAMEGVPGLFVHVPELVELPASPGPKLDKEFDAVENIRLMPESLRIEVIARFMRYLADCRNVPLGEVLRAHSGFAAAVGVITDLTKKIVPGDTTIGARAFDNLIDHGITPSLFANILTQICVTVEDVLPMYLHYCLAGLKGAKITAEPTCIKYEFDGENVVVDRKGFIRSKSDSADSVLKRLHFNLVEYSDDELAVYRFIISRFSAKRIGTSSGLELLPNVSAPANFQMKNCGFDTVGNIIFSGISQHFASVTYEAKAHVGSYVGLCILSHIRKLPKPYFRSLLLKVKELEQFGAQNALALNQKVDVLNENPLNYGPSINLLRDENFINLCNLVGIRPLTMGELTFGNVSSELGKSRTWRCYNEVGDMHWKHTSNSLMINGASMEWRGRLAELAALGRSIYPQGFDSKFVFAVRHRAEGLDSILGLHDHVTGRQVLKLPGQVFVQWGAWDPDHYVILLDEAGIYEEAVMVDNEAIVGNASNGIYNRHWHCVARIIQCRTGGIVPTLLKADITPSALMRDLVEKNGYTLRFVPFGRGHNLEGAILVLPHNSPLADHVPTPSRWASDVKAFITQAYVNNVLRQGNMYYCGDFYEYLNGYKVTLTILGVVEETLSAEKLYDHMIAIQYLDPDRYDSNDRRIVLQAGLDPASPNVKEDVGNWITASTKRKPPGPDVHVSVQAGVGVDTGGGVSSSSSSAPAPPIGASPGGLSSGRGQTPPAIVPPAAAKVPSLGSFVFGASSPSK